MPNKPRRKIVRQVQHNGTVLWWAVPVGGRPDVRSVSYATRGQLVRTLGNRCELIEDKQ